MILQTFHIVPLSPLPFSLKSFFLSNIETLSHILCMMSRSKSPRATKRIQTFLQSTKSCIWHLHMVKNCSTENSRVIFRWLQIYLPQRAAVSEGGGEDLVTFHIFLKEKLLKWLVISNHSNFGLNLI